MAETKNEIKKIREHIEKKAEIKVFEKRGDYVLIQVPGGIGG